MEYRIEELVEGLTYAQLVRMQFDLSHGSIQLKKLVDSRIKHLEAQNRRVCATCSCAILDDSDHVYTIMFGPSDFRKKATCCGMDCFEQFLTKLKQYEGINVNGI